MTLSMVEGSGSKTGECQGSCGRRPDWVAAGGPWSEGSTKSLLAERGSEARPSVPVYRRGTGHLILGPWVIF